MNTSTQSLRSEFQLAVDARLPGIRHGCELAEAALDSGVRRDAMQHYQQVVEQITFILSLPAEGSDSQLALTELHLTLAVIYMQYASWIEQDRQASDYVAYALSQCVASMDTLQKSEVVRYAVIEAWHTGFAVIVSQIRELAVLAQVDSGVIVHIDGMLEAASDLLGEALLQENQALLKGMEFLTQGRIMLDIARTGESLYEQESALQSALEGAATSAGYLVGTSDTALYDQALALSETIYGHLAHVRQVLREGGR